MWGTLQSFSQSVNWAALSYASQLVLWLCILGTVLYVGLMSGLNIVEMLSTRYACGNSIQTFLNWRMRSVKARRLVNRWMPRMGMLLIGYIIGQAQIFSPVRELHDATVVSRDADRIYTVSVAGHRQVIRLCAWGDELPLRSGMVMTLMQYKQQADCMLIDGDTYVSYLRDQNKNVVDSAGHILFAKEE